MCLYRRPYGPILQKPTPEAERWSQASHPGLPDCKARVCVPGHNASQRSELLMVAFQISDAVTADEGRGSGQMVPNRAPASGCQGRQRALPSIPLVRGTQAGRSPPHSPHHPPPALWPCLGDPHELSFPAALRRSQPGQRLSLPSRRLAVPREAGLPRGWGSFPATRPPPVLSPNSGAPWGSLQRRRLRQVVQGWGTPARPVPVAAALLSCH